MEEAGGRSHPGSQDPLSEHRKQAPISMSNSNEFVWVEKYRPITVAECILPADLKKIFLKFAEDGDFPNLLLAGPKGMGKTSVAKSLVSGIGADMYFVNGSKERTIDVVRDKLANFVT